MPEIPNAARNRAIFAAHAEGLPIRQIAETHGLTCQRVRQLLRNGRDGKTLTLLPGTEKLTPITREWLIRQGYRSVDAILADVAQGKLYPRCTTGIATKRFAEIVAWAREMDASSKPAARRQSRPSAALAA